MKKLLSIITIIIAGTAYADDVYWELRKIERAIEWQAFEERQRERERRHDKWMDEFFGDEFFGQREQGERNHRYCEEEE